jgi:hypothetical protein
VGKLALTLLLFTSAVAAQAPQQSAPSNDDPEARPPVTSADIKIARRAQQILSSAAKWNRADTRVCPTDAKTFSLYCALEAATDEVTGKFQHRGAAMQEARFIVDEVAARKNYEHRLQDYNNDPTTTFADIQAVLRQLQRRLTRRLTKQAHDAANP